MTTFKRNKVKKRSYTRRKKDNFFDKFIIRGTLGLILFIILFFIFTYFKYIYTLPKITTLEEIKIPEASILYDRNGEKLYTLYSGEKRTYVSFDEISKNIVNAIVSAEDKTFYDNPGFDLKGIFRAFFYYTIQKTDKIEGTSTISQQLIKNIFLSNERKIVRKIKELYLSYKLNKTYSKNKILEIYLNKISFGSNAYGVEQASLTFFGKKANELNVLEGSIIASLPKGPTYYSPYSHADRLLGFLYKYPNNQEQDTIKLLSSEKINKSQLAMDFINYISGLRGKRLDSTGNKILICGIDKNKSKVSIDTQDSCYTYKYSDLLSFLNSIKLSNDETSIEYQTGRKDFVLGRLLEDGKITFDEYKKSLIDSIGFDFKKYKEEIKAPHFVFYVKEYLEEKYGENILGQEGLSIYTTLDLEKQIKAEEILKEQVEINKTKFDSSNGALLSIDNMTGEIISMVGSVDYFNDSIDGNVNMITSTRQPGSTFKSFVFAKAIENNKIGTSTPVFDLKTEFPGNYTPNNYDGKFEGLMSITEALNHSRNIPAIKMYFLGGQQEEIISFMKKLGVSSLNEKFYYGAPLSIGTGEMSPLELARAYSVFANEGILRESSPILKTIDSKGNIIEQKENQGFGKIVMDKGLSYIMNNILSSTFARPNNFRNNYLSLNDRQSGAKTGTSNKVTNKKDSKGNYIILPGDMWTVGYTPQYTTVVWAGNTDGTELNSKGNGLEGAGPVWKNFMEYLHEGKEKLLWSMPNNVKEVKISKISGKLVEDDYESGLVVKSLFLENNIPTEYDNSLKEIKIDLLCNGIVTNNTPLLAKSTGYFIDFKSLSPEREKWEEPIKKWIEDGGANELIKGFNNIITSYNPEPCFRDPKKLSNAFVSIDIDNIRDRDILQEGSNYIKINYSSFNQLREINIKIDGNKVKTFNYNELDKKGSIDGYFDIPEKYVGKKVNISIEALDEIYYGSIRNIEVGVSKKRVSVPEIIITNPIDGDKVLYPTQHFNLRGTVIDNTSIRSINIYLNGEPLIIGLKDKDFVFPINEDHLLPIGEYIIKIEAVNSGFKIGTKEIKLTIINN